MEAVTPISSSDISLEKPTPYKNQRLNIDTTKPRL
jgi:hypothetical protein